MVYKYIATFSFKEEHRKFDDASISSPMSFQRQLLKWFVKHDYEEFFDSEVDTSSNIVCFFAISTVLEYA